MRPERTLCILKPDVVRRGQAGDVLARVLASGLKLAAMKMVRMDVVTAEMFYVEHDGKSFFKELVSFMSGGPVIAAVFEGKDAVARYRKVAGSTDPATAEPGTVRKDFGTCLAENAVHGSDSVESARREVAFFFAESEIVCE